MGLDEFLVEIKEAAVELKTLDIITAVGPLTWIDDKKKYMPVAGAPVKVMRTKLDIFEGDKTTWIDDAFVTGELAALREYHQKAEASGHEMFRQNLAALKGLFELVLNLHHTASDSTAKP